jgi:hypothetical protein
MRIARRHRQLCAGGNKRPSIQLLRLRLRMHQLLDVRMPRKAGKFYTLIKLVVME